jgi:hypothetical protein
MMIYWRKILDPLLAIMATVCIPVVATAQGPVIINGERLSQEQIQGLESLARTHLISGDYWYDKQSGLWGLKGGPALGVGLPNLTLGGSLQPDASNGNTKVFINGRELHFLDVAFLQTLGPVLPGRYWLDALGNCGFEGHPMPFVNLIALMQQKGGQRDNYRSNGNGFFNSQGGFTYSQHKDAGGNHYNAWSGR